MTFPVVSIPLAVPYKLMLLINWLRNLPWSFYFICLPLWHGRLKWSPTPILREQNISKQLSVICKIPRRLEDILSTKLFKMLILLRWKGSIAKFSWITARLSPVWCMVCTWPRTTGAAQVNLPSDNPPWKYGMRDNLYRTIVRQDKPRFKKVQTNRITFRSSITMTMTMRYQSTRIAFMTIYEDILQFSK